MTTVRVHNFTISLDGFGAGADQSLEDPLGKGGEDMHSFFFTEERHPEDQRFFDWGTENIGAHMMGRNMFGPVRGEWPAANGQDVRIGGGVSTVRHYLRTGDIDVLHVAISPMLLGSGESLFDGMAGVMAGYECTEVTHGNVAHLVFTKR